MSDEITPLELSRERRITLPLALLAGALAAVAAGSVALSSTRDQVSRNTADIGALQAKVANDHDVLVEINANVKRLLRNEPGAP